MIIYKYHSEVVDLNPGYTQPKKLYLNGQCLASNESEARLTIAKTWEDRGYRVLNIEFIGTVEHTKIIIEDLRFSEVYREDS